ncbi:zinc ribbon domain-containing protein [Streptomyces sp. NPDC017964]|uniref:zinc ribbon domain-containing protein n=1 Tax=Streptomyces sp. NPDC017964 TaxID=3365022 RepID=UPI00379B28D8
MTAIPDVGVTGYGIHLPLWRLDRAQIRKALGSGGGKGTRAVASYDEDSTSMGVEAARRALAGAPAPHGLVFATATPAYTDKTNATTLHAALGLERGVPAYDFTGAARSGVGALFAAADSAAAGRSSLAVLSDIRTGLPGSAEERDGGDAAAAVLFGTGDAVLARLAGRGSASAEFLERWRPPGEPSSRLWEERFAEGIYKELADEAVESALKDAGLDRSAIDRVAVAGLHRRAVKSITRSLGRDATVGDDLAGVIGATGTAQPGVLLASALDEAGPDETVLLLVLGDGADALVFRTTAELAAWRERRPYAPVAEQAAEGREVTYQTFLTWRGFLRREPPRRPDPERPAGPASARNAHWKYGLTGSRCEECGTRHLPAIRVCRACHSVDRMTREQVADLTATVATFQSDLLTYSLNPPLTAAVLDFDGGGRAVLEVTDADVAQLAIGDRLEMTFRRLYTTGDGVHNYFWKARPARAADAAHQAKSRTAQGGTAQVRTAGEEN